MHMPIDAISPARSGALSGTIAYCVPEFPGQTHAFFWREIQALEAAGMRLELVSTREPADGSCPHAFDAEARARTTYLHPPAMGAVRRVLWRRRGKLRQALDYLAEFGESAASHRVRLLGLVFTAATLVDRCEKAGVSHVHFHSMADSAHVGALASILGGLSYSLTLHGDLTVYGKDHASKITRAALVTAVTAPLAEQIRQIVPERQVPVIWMGVDTDRFAPVTQTPGANGPLHVVTVARLNRAKGHRFFLEAMAAAVSEGMDVRYSIAGEGPYRDRLVEEIRGFGLEGRVDLLGSVGEDDVLALLRRADVFALTSVGRGEAAPVSVMEAMACGVPVICSRIGGTADMILDGVQGHLVGPEDVDGILAALRALASDHVMRRRLSTAAREKALEAFDYRLKALELGHCIRSVMTLDGVPPVAPEGVHPQ